MYTPTQKVEYSFNTVEDFIEQNNYTLIKNYNLSGCIESHIYNTFIDTNPLSLGIWCNNLITVIL